MKRIALLALSLAAVFLVLAASAGAAPAPKATGDYGYSYGGVQRHVTFAAIQSTSTTCGVFWNVQSVTQFTFYVNGDLSNTPYSHHASLTQTGQSVSGSGGYPLTGGDSFHWNIDTGSIVGNTLTLSMTYDLGAPGTVMTMTGTVASNGSISGTWTDNYGGTRTGTFTAPAGSATAQLSFCGKGTFYYSDEQGYWYFGVVKAVSVSGNTAWYAAKILASNFGFEAVATNYLFVRVIDNGEPGIGHDVTGGEPMTPVDAVNAVLSHQTPSANATINAGNIQVH